MKSERKSIEKHPPICDYFNHRHVMYELIPPEGTLNLIIYSGPGIFTPTTSSTSHT